jgi:pimeloyl-ACP methyl ester carboxylesterase
MHAVQARPGPARALSGDAPRCFYAGTDAFPVYVDQLQQAGASTKAPVVMVHGGGHTGACYLMTPDSRAGWAQHFAAAGRDVFVPDWPGHGRSPMRPDFPTLGTADVAASKQAGEFGLVQAGKVSQRLILFLQDVHALGLNVAQGTYLTTTSYWDMNDATRAWSKEFMARTA